MDYAVLVALQTVAEWTGAKKYLLSFGFHDIIRREKVVSNNGNRASEVRDYSVMSGLFTSHAVEGPFVVILKSRDAKSPYIMAYIANEELLLK